MFEMLITFTVAQVCKMDADLQGIAEKRSDVGRLDVLVQIEIRGREHRPAIGDYRFIFSSFFGWLFKQPCFFDDFVAKVRQRYSVIEQEILLGDKFKITLQKLFVKRGLKFLKQNGII
jgi:hypothetical protein